ncbi:hypothetical protein SAY87_004276 [Trapa incisa]|uniref:Uncharacterized protein n=1 Tax=Trapa incisa TaxID=236973 RepID=A0AAN7JNQ0_9MYRT|nr:hypothetical protein SAY87_004276 [Trapa incisa]
MAIFTQIDLKKCVSWDVVKEEILATDDGSMFQAPKLAFPSLVVFWWLSVSIFQRVSCSSMEEFSAFAAYLVTSGTFELNMAAKMGSLREKLVSMKGGGSQIDFSQFESPDDRSA